MSLSDTEFENSLLESKKYRYLRIDIQELSQEDKVFIRNNLLEIISGSDGYLSFEAEIKELLAYLNRIDINKRNGAVAELVVICLLKIKGFSQEYCYKNLEENSAKKGFDGLVTKDSEVWIIESKSSQIGHNNSHRNTIHRAYNGLKKQLSGENTKINNPWRNAYNHAKVAQSSDTLLRKIAKLSADYTDKKYLKIEDNNIIIGSTVIPDNKTDSQSFHSISEIDSNIQTLDCYIKKHESKDEVVIVINLQTIQIFMDFLEEIVHE